MKVLMHALAASCEELRARTGNPPLEVEGMGFMFGKSSVEPSLKLHLLRLEMQPLYQDVKICDLALLFNYFQ
jgi:hypothetical protein